MGIKNPKTENDVKALVKKWFDERQAWHFAPIQNGLGQHGIHDRIGCVPVVVTQAMVGKTIGLFVSVESKRPGRRGEENRGMSKHQLDTLKGIAAAGGMSLCSDGADDLGLLDMGLIILRERDGKTDFHTCVHMRQKQGPCGREKRLHVDG